MIIDSHIHFGIDKDGYMTSTEDILFQLKLAKINRAIIFPFNEQETNNNFLSANEKILDAIKQNKEFIGGFRLDPNLDFKSMVDWSVKNNFKILKLHPRSQKFNLNQENVHSLLTYLSDNYSHIPIFIHTDIIPMENAIFSNLTQPKDILSIAQKFKKLNFIICHTGRPSDETIDGIKNTNNVYFDTSIIPLFLIKDIIKNVSHKRILFGSDYPYSNPLIEKQKIDLIDISENEKTAIFSGNLIKLLNL